MSDSHKGENSTGNWKQVMNFELFYDSLRVPYLCISEYNYTHTTNHKIHIY